MLVETKFKLMLAGERDFHGISTGAFKSWAEALLSPFYDESADSILSEGALF